MVLWTYISMASQEDSLEDLTVDTVWEDRDSDIVVQYQIDKKLNLESVDELSQ